MHKRAITLLGGALLVTTVANAQVEESIFNRVYLGGHLTSSSEVTESLQGVRIGGDYQINKNFILDGDYLTETLTVASHSISNRHTTIAGGYIYPISNSQALPSYLFAKGGLHMSSTKKEDGNIREVSNIHTGIYVSGGMRGAATDKVWSEFELSYRSYGSKINEPEFLLSAELGLDIADNAGVSLYTEVLSGFDIASIGLSVGYTF